MFLLLGRMWLTINKSPQKRHEATVNYDYVRLCDPCHPRLGQLPDNCASAIWVTNSSVATTLQCSSPYGV